MTDEALKIRHKAAVLQAERNVKAAATLSITAWLLAVDPAAPQNARDDWDKRREHIIEALAAIWLLRFKATGARRSGQKALLEAFKSSIRPKLSQFPDQVFGRIEAEVVDGTRAGLSKEAIDARIKEILSPTEWSSKPELIARTETTAAYNSGAQAGYAETVAEGAPPVFKRWLGITDERIRDSHLEATFDDANQKVPLDGYFSVGGFHAKYPGDESLPVDEVANCRCVAVFLQSDGTDILDSEGIVAALRRQNEEFAVATPDENALPDGWRGPIAALDVETGDKRMLSTPADGLKTRAYPLSLTQGHVGDGDAPVIGSIDRVWGENGELYGEGKLDLGGDAGAEFARQLQEGYTNSVSIHPSAVTAEMQLVLADGTVLVGEEAQKAFEANDYQLPEGSHDRMAMTDWVLAGLAAVPIPAYTQARIEPVYGYEPSGPQKGDAKVVLQEGIVAGVGGQVFRREFFEAVATGPTKPTITEDGHFFGHVRLYGTCYQYGGGAGNGGVCVEPPLSATNYDKFHRHGAKLEDGSILDVGVITFGEGHYSRGSLQASIDHITKVSTMSVKVVATEDQWGVWVTGEVLDAYRDQAYDLLLSPLSGHWEPDADNDGHLEMVAAHIVVTPGYTVPSRIVASLSDGVNPDHVMITEAWTGAKPPAAAVDRKAILAALGDIAREQKRAEKLAKRAGVDPNSRLDRAMARIGAPRS